jgi:hypothetical protein
VNYDHGPIMERLIAAGATETCLCCGSSEVRYSDTRYALIDLDANDKLAVETDWGLASGLFCIARICNACGFVHLHGPRPIPRD